ncbi:MAG: SDR family oxidoreductase [Candidatus Azotimanducaceae bacterium]|uniref:Aldehyde reductase n=1 Tax=OM182 bacterium TaxID=2510334 RepID=A0A520RZW8_9GAMM|nr:epimerase [Gammaproteobacteria bacterium]RZO75766.1 MAG: aldehyde reductase [OM182 bacterium]
MASPETVLVTGASGFIATHCILKLASQGYKIRGTVRDLSRVASLETLLSAGLKKYYQTSNLDINWYQADLNTDNGWIEAVKDCNYVLHVASPVTFSVYGEDELIATARNGTLRVLKAASVAKVRRTVVTSSIAAISAGHHKNHNPFTEDIWSDITNSECSPYEKSKTLAERAAWDFLGKGSTEMEICTINPSLVFGPVLEKDIGESVGVLREMLEGKYPLAPKLNFGIVDVRDVAELHFLAMTCKESPGNRFICNSETLSVLEVSKLVQKLYPEYKKRLPNRCAPNWLIKLAAFFDPLLRLAVPMLGAASTYDHSKATTLLGWQPRPASEAIQGSTESLIRLGVVESSS